MHLDELHDDWRRGSFQNIRDPIKVGSDLKILYTKELILSRNPEIPLASGFRGIWVRDKSNIRLRDPGSVTAAEGRERMCTKIIKHSTAV